MTTTQDEIEEQIVRLLTEVKSVTLATVHQDGSPLASYTPFSENDEKNGLWILVSDLAGHAQNLARSKECSVLVIRDEQDSAQVYVRERLQYEMDAAECPRDDTRWNEGVAALRDRHGGLVDTLTSLGDFRLFQLRPQAGRYVVGFGQAYELKAGSLSVIDHHLQGPTGPQKD
jgi:putative heme iron utilization protein